MGLTKIQTKQLSILGDINTFTVNQKINCNSTIALLIEQDGIKDNTLVVDTTNGFVGINTASQSSGSIFRVSDTTTSIIGHVGILFQMTSTPASSIGYSSHRSVNISSTFNAGSTAMPNASVWGAEFEVALFTNSTFYEAAGFQSQIVMDAACTTPNVTHFIAGSFQSYFTTPGTVTNIVGARIYTGSVLTTAGTLNVTSIIGADIRLSDTAIGSTINIGSVYGVKVHASVLNMGTLTAVTWYGYYYESIEAGIVPTTEYGIYLESILRGTTKYAIWTNVGLNRFGDQLSIVGNADRIQLQVKANATQTTNLQTWETSAGAVMVSVTGSGYLGVGTGSPTTRFHVYGTTTAHYAQIDTGLNFLQVTKPSVPTMDLIATDTGNIDIGDHWYWVTYTNTFGETNVSSNTTVVTIDANHRQVTVNIPVSSDYRVTGRKIYRSKVGSSYQYTPLLLAIIANNSQTTYTDNTADTGLTGTRAYYRPNTTNAFLRTNGSVAAIADIYLTVFGSNAGASVTSGFNTFIGSSAGYSNTSGNSNALIGTSAGYNLTIQTDNTFIGEVCGYYVKSSANTAIGSYALYGNGVNLTGGYNTVVGSWSGYQTQGAAIGNTMLGGMSGNSNTTGGYNIYLGYYAGRRQTTASNQLIIDNVARADIATEISSAILYGVMAALPSNQTLRLNAAVIIEPTIAGALTIGAGATGIDYILKFDGETNDGIITWMEDEDYFKFSDTVVFSGAAIGFFNHTPAVQSAAYTVINALTDRAYDADSTTLDELADVVGTLVADLQSIGLVG